MTRWITRWTRWSRRLTKPRTVSRPRSAIVLPALQDEDEVDALPGCGWFDSSWELRRGLAVIEGPALDPLGLWSGRPRWSDSAPNA